MSFFSNFFSLQPAGARGAVYGALQPPRSAPRCRRLASAVEKGSRDPGIEGSRGAPTSNPIPGRDDRPGAIAPKRAFAGSGALRNQPILPSHDPQPAHLNTTPRDPGRSKHGSWRPSCAAGGHGRRPVARPSGAKAENRETENRNANTACPCVALFTSIEKRRGKTECRVAALRGSRDQEIEGSRS